VQRLMDSLPDPAGVFYMYSLPSSILRRRKVEASGRRDAVHGMENANV
jgi:hypothetical protein